MARTVRGPKRNHSYRETGSTLRTRRSPYTPTGNWRAKVGRAEGLDDFKVARRAAIARTRNVAGVSEVGRVVGRGVRGRKSRMPRR